MTNLVFITVSATAVFFYWLSCYLFFAAIGTFSNVLGGFLAENVEFTVFIQRNDLAAFLLYTMMTNI